MRCPVCGSKTGASQTAERATGLIVQRRRTCAKCKQSFASWEAPIPLGRDGKRLAAAIEKVAERVEGNQAGERLSAAMYVATIFSDQCARLIRALDRDARETAAEIAHAVERLRGIRLAGMPAAWRHQFAEALGDVTDALRRMGICISDVVDPETGAPVEAAVDDEPSEEVAA